MWHVDGFSFTDSNMDELTRAAIWYSHHGKIANSRLHGIKAMRECSDINIEDSDGKYSFQYVDGLEINDSDLDTKDAF